MISIPELKIEIMSQPPGLHYVLHIFRHLPDQQLAIGGGGRLVLLD
jgi:hypothetical protein